MVALSSIVSAYCLQPYFFSCVCVWMCACEYTQTNTYFCRQVDILVWPHGFLPLQFYTRSSLNKHNTEISPLLFMHMNRIKSIFLRAMNFSHNNNLMNTLANETWWGGPKCYLGASVLYYTLCMTAERIYNIITTALSWSQVVVVLCNSVSQQVCLVESEAS